MRKCENMTASEIRKEIESDYKIKSGIIQSPGKFEGEPVYIPYFFELILKGMQDTTVYQGGMPIDGFKITPDDIDTFPELGKIKEIAIWQRSDGSVCHDTDI
jgi:hypothetical protein